MHALRTQDSAISQPTSDSELRAGDCFVAIDPGIAGGIVVFHGGIPTSAYIMPLNQKKDENRIDGAIFMGYMEEHSPRSVVFEKQLAYAAKGTAGTASAFFNLGVLAGICTGLGITVHYVHPRTWQAFYAEEIANAQAINNTSLHNRKFKHVQVAQKLFPHINLMPLRRRRPHDGIADALLIGDFYYRSGLYATL